MRISARTKSDAIRKLLAVHPGVHLLDGVSRAAIDLEQNGKKRRVWIDRPDIEPFGLMEIIDNNPLVCADECSVPSPEATLALIALGPLIRAGLLTSAPAAMFSFEANLDSVDASLRTMGWDHGLTASLNVEEPNPPADPGSIPTATWHQVKSAIVMATLSTPDDASLLDSLYDGVYGGSFFVRRVEDGPWITSLVEGRPFAAYRLRFAPDVGESLLTIQVMADSEGKCGAAQAVHAMNVMCGFEESLGIL